MNVAIAGASGLVGSALTTILLRDGAQITRLVRSKPKAGEIEWHPNQDEVSPKTLEGFDVIVNLAGENIAAGRWSDDQKRKIRDSRVNGSHLLSEAIARMTTKPRVFVCASATAISGDGDAKFWAEKRRRGGVSLRGFCREWSQALDPAGMAGLRLSNLQFGRFWLAKAAC